MEQWEIDYRAELEQSLPEGTHEIGVVGHMQLVSKQAKINYEVSIKKQNRLLDIRLKILTDQQKADIEEWVEAFKNK